MNREHYIFEDGKVKTVPMLEWAVWLEHADRHVASTRIGKTWVSTVFIGLDHNYSDEGPPLIIETMVFDEKGTPTPMNEETVRYATVEQARRGHGIIVQRVCEWHVDAQPVEEECALGTIPIDRAASYSRALKYLEEQHDH